MERFFNAGSECVVLERKGDIALIARIDEQCEPYVVPISHVQGEASWWGGRYFSSLGRAQAFFQEVAV